MSSGRDPPDGGAGRRPLTRVAIDVPATAERLQDVHDALARFWAAVAGSLHNAPAGPWRAAFETAVAEVAANIVRHAYPDGAAGAGGKMRFRLDAYPDAIEARFADDGVDFRPGAGDAAGPLRAPPPEPAPPAAAGPVHLGDLDGLDGLDGLDDLLATADLAEGGYGLPLARAALDTLAYSRSAGGENEWWLVKRLPPPPAE